MACPRIKYQKFALVSAFVPNQYSALSIEKPTRPSALPQKTEEPGGIKVLKARWFHIFYPRGVVFKVDLNGQTSIERLYALGECSCTGLHGGNRLASNSLIEAVVYAETAARNSLEHVDYYDFNEKVPEWNDEGTLTNEEKVLITQSVKEVNQIMSNYVGIVRSDLRLHRAWDRLDMLYEETERLFKRVKASKDICELRNMINVGYLITRWALERKECRGLHYTTDYPVHAYDK